MSVSHLVALLETGQYRRCLEEALSLLAAGEPDRMEDAQIRAAICRCQLQLGAARTALTAGEQALALAGADADPDWLAGVLIDLGTARARVRQHAAALEVWDRYLQLLPRLSGLRCQEGAVRYRMAESLRRLGQAELALESYRLARRWLRHFGDEDAAWACTRGMIATAIETGALQQARLLLLEGEEHMGDAANRFRAGQLMDWARYLLAGGRPDLAADRAFAALELADGLEQQGEAQMLLCRTAEQQAKPVEAFSFALAARVSAMEANLYSLEFEAAEVIFRLLRQHGQDLLGEVAADFANQGVDIYDYLSELAIRRCVT